MHQGIVEQGVEQVAQLAVVAADGQGGRRGHAQAPPLGLQPRGDGGRHLAHGAGQVQRAARFGRGGAVGARQRQQGRDHPLELGQVGAHHRPVHMAARPLHACPPCAGPPLVGLGALQPQVQHRQGRAQRMGGVGGEAALGGVGGGDPVQPPVDGQRQGPHLGRQTGVRQPRSRPLRPDRRRLFSRPAQGTQAPARHQPRYPQRQHRQAAHQAQRKHVLPGVRRMGRRGAGIEPGDHHHAAEGRRRAQRQVLALAHQPQRRGLGARRQQDRRRGRARPRRPGLQSAVGTVDGIAGPAEAIGLDPGPRQAHRGHAARPDAQAAYHRPRLGLQAGILQHLAHARRVGGDQGSGGGHAQDEHHRQADHQPRAQALQQLHRAAPAARAPAVRR